MRIKDLLLNIASWVFCMAVGCSAFMIFWLFLRLMAHIVVFLFA